jgi:hypothetical protein
MSSPQGCAVRVRSDHASGTSKRGREGKAAMTIMALDLWTSLNPNRLAKQPLRHGLGSIQPRALAPTSLSTDCRYCGAIEFEIALRMQPRPTMHGRHVHLVEFVNPQYPYNERAPCPDQVCEGQCTYRRTNRNANSSISWDAICTSCPRTTCKTPPGRSFRLRLGR